MQYQKEYHSPLGEMLLAADDEGLVGIWFQGAVHFGRGLEPGGREGEHPFLSEAERWLDCYFSGHEPEFQPPIHWRGTPFQQTVRGISEDSLGGAVPHPLWERDHLWRTGPDRGCPTGPGQHVSPGGRGRGGPQPHLYPHPLPPGGGGGRQPDRICRRPGAEAPAAGSGGCGEDLPRSGGLGGKLTGGTVILKRAVLFYFSRISSASFSSHSSSVAA